MQGGSKRPLNVATEANTGHSGTQKMLETIGPLPTCQENLRPEVDCIHIETSRATNIKS